MKYDYKAIGERAEKERRKLKLSKVKLAEKIGYSDERPITALEKNGKLLPLEQMLEMCKIFNCELSYLLCEQDYKTRVATDICEETGLSEEAVIELKSQLLAAQRAQNSRFNEENNDIKYFYTTVTKFINYYLKYGKENLESINKYVSHIRSMEWLKKDKYYNNILDIYIETSSSSEWNAFGQSSRAMDFYDRLEEMFYNELSEKIPKSTQYLSDMIENGDVILNEDQAERLLNKFGNIDNNVKGYMDSYVGVFETLKNNENIRYFESDIEKSFMDIVKNFKEEYITEFKKKINKEIE